MARAVILPLLVAVAVQRHIVGCVRDAQIAEDAFIWSELRQPFFLDPASYLMSILHRNFHARRVIVHLPKLPLADNVEAPDHLECGFPVPYVRREFKVLATQISQCEAHRKMLIKRAASVNSVVEHSTYELTFRITKYRMYYMNYTTTVTSKGTITLPSQIRKAFRIMPGRKLTVSVNDNGEIVVKPGTTFEEFEELREHIVAKIPKEKLGLTGRALKEAIAEAWVADHR